jgi:hypothetical protein
MREIDIVLNCRNRGNANIYTAIRERITNGINFGPLLKGS